ncbi:MAG: class I SAM-dependent methyltransferase [Candidatus Omnitrophica bacterium]|nr:class I SAM-dependent methyltransferase [Candidatus Omnitrophota bacterium]
MPLLERDLVPDGTIRAGIRLLCRAKLREEYGLPLEERQEKFAKLLQELRASPIAVATDAANRQHYEVPAEFFKCCLGRHMKYSCGYWKPGVESLDQGEEDMLNLTIERAGLSDGQDVLELGCGWGSLSLLMAARFPNSRLVGVSNSRTQKEYIDARIRERGIKNLSIITADVNVFETGARFDRVVSVEMFEHMRNYEKLLAAVTGFLKPGGRLFVHIFTHKQLAYYYDAQDKSDWIGKYFFTGGIMPSDHLLLYFQGALVIERHWQVGGEHYQKTAEAWLRNMDNNKRRILPVFQEVYGQDYKKWWVYWRVFFMACAEMWGYGKGEEWMVSHYLFKKELPV